MRHPEYQYLDVMQEILDDGVDKNDRTKTGTKSLFGKQLRFDLQKGFPLLTTKKVHWRSIVHELLWMISGDTNIAYLEDNKITIWREWADENGDLGPVYGSQWRNYNNQNVDQLKILLQTLEDNPDGRRHLLLAWNPIQLSLMRLPPCHFVSQFYVANNNLSCMMTQRSCDFFFWGGLLILHHMLF